jgi:hypothetical protein
MSVFGLILVIFYLPKTVAMISMPNTVVAISKQTWINEMHFLHLIRRTPAYETPETYFSGKR